MSVNIRTQPKCDAYDLDLSNGGAAALFDILGMLSHEENEMDPAELIRRVDAAIPTPAQVAACADRGLEALRTLGHLRDIARAAQKVNGKVIWS